MLPQESPVPTDKYRHSNRTAKLKRNSPMLTADTKRRAGLVALGLATGLFHLAVGAFCATRFSPQTTHDRQSRRVATSISAASSAGTRIPAGCSRVQSCRAVDSEPGVAVQSPRHLDLANRRVFVLRRGLLCLGRDMAPANRRGACHLEWTYLLDTRIGCGPPALQERCCPVDRRRASTVCGNPGETQRANQSSLCSPRPPS